MKRFIEEFKVILGLQNGEETFYPFCEENMVLIICEYVEKTNVDFWDAK